MPKNPFHVQNPLARICKTVVLFIIPGRQTHIKPTSGGTFCVCGSQLPRLYICSYPLQHLALSAVPNPSPLHAAAIEIIKAIKEAHSLETNTSPTSQNISAKFNDKYTLRNNPPSFFSWATFNPFQFIHNNSRGNSLKGLTCTPRSSVSYIFCFPQPLP
jgi:hypothetical protein